jgi:hypothetical protein
MRIYIWRAALFIYITIGNKKESNHSNRTQNIFFHKIYIAIYYNVHKLEEEKFSFCEKLKIYNVLVNRLLICEI